MPGAADLTAVVVAARSLEDRTFTSSDDELLADTDLVEQLGRVVDGLRLRHAAELEHRSRPLLGEQSLAFRNGAKDGIQLVEQVTRTSHREAARRVGLGAAVAHRRGLLDETLPGRIPALTDAIDAGAIGVEAARVIVDLVKQTRFKADPEDVAAAVDSLLHAARQADVGTVREIAAGWRLALDPDGAKPSERKRRRNRALTIGTTLEDGTTKVTAILLPEHLALLKELLQSRRRTVPLVRTEAGSDHEGEPLEPEWREEPDEASEDDPRSRSQQDYDTLIDALELAVRAEAAGFEGTTTTHQVVITATLDDVVARDGAAWSPGIMAGLPVPTVEQLACTAETRLQINDTDGEPLFLSRSHRLFSPAQRLAMTVAAGGRCEYPGCRVPHPYLQAHHVEWFQRDAGETYISNGIMLCSYHHHLIHAKDSPVEIRRHNGDLYIVPKAWTAAPDESQRRDRHRPPGRVRKIRLDLNPDVFAFPTPSRN